MKNFMILILSVLLAPASFAGQFESDTYKVREGLYCKASGGEGFEKLEFTRSLKQVKKKGQHWPEFRDRLFTLIYTEGDGKPWRFEGSKQAYDRISDRDIKACIREYIRGAPFTKELVKFGG